MRNMAPRRYSKRRFLKIVTWLATRDSPFRQILCILLHIRLHASQTPVDVGWTSRSHQRSKTLYRTCRRGDAAGSLRHLPCWTKKLRVRKSQYWKNVVTIDKRPYKDGMDNTNCLCTEKEGHVTVLRGLPQAQRRSKKRLVSDTWNRWMYRHSRESRNRFRLRR